MRTVLSLAMTGILAISAIANGQTAAELKSAAEDVVGAWMLDFTTPDEVKRTPTVLVGRQYDEFVAWYMENDRLETFSDVRLKNDKLHLKIRPMERADITVSLEAWLEADGVCAGKGSYVADDGETGSWDFAGKRMSPSDFDEMERWKLSFETPDYEQHEAVVTVVEKNDEAYGWYSSEDYELPAKTMSVDGDKVEMSLAAKTRDGERVDVTFRGTRDGDRVDGEADYELEGEKGSFPFSAVRMP